ncbi:hypothetical protein CONLIGDRAFT_621189 [Coniochaeta ligniaria NRRL 30616]|uniref:Saccharopine dehydrogenase NADP binding domain-containing protein n=1 Tax=Coniochaeta ligniaria NRRL 30616 TaxID=1408157 RepID=A0A1J7IHW7_9PEZI|nr:hypothetical protein CONLIGDRAFT_621189 [Coniochaeta ligniaria NRRL 30616]
MATLMIYGATGYTGRMISKHAKELGLNTLLAGRGEASLRELAVDLDLPYRVFDVESLEHNTVALKDVTVLLNCAGPFYRTAKPLMTRCLRDGVHYLDITAELDSYRIAGELDQEAKERNVMLLPGCGGSVAMLGCLAGHVVAQLGETPSRIDIALHVAGSMSRGSAISAKENMTTECLQRLGGLLVEQDGTALTDFDFRDGNGAVPCFPASLPDLFTIWRSTEVQNIRTFVHVSGDAFPSADLDALPLGPTDEERDAAPYHAAVAVTARDGTIKRAVLHTVNGYTFTAAASVEAARRVMAGEAKGLGGFQTPAAAFGNDFVTTVQSSSIEYL